MQPNNPYLYLLRLYSPYLYLLRVDSPLNGIVRSISSTLNTQKSPYKRGSAAYTPMIKSMVVNRVGCRGAAFNPVRLILQCGLYSNVAYTPENTV